MIVFSNTTPLIALSSIGQLELMPRLFGKVHVVSEVIDECATGGAISVPRLRTLNWVLEVQSTPIDQVTPLLALDRGEKHTLDMALKAKANRVIIDEKLGRALAEYLGLTVTGTLGILLHAKQAGWISSFRAVVAEMQEQGIRYHPALIEKLAASIGE